MMIPLIRSVLEKKITKKRKLKDTINPLQLLIFTVVLDGSLCVRYFIYLKFAPVSLSITTSLAQLNKKIG